MGCSGMEVMLQQQTGRAMKFVRKLLVSACPPRL